MPIAGPGGETWVCRSIRPGVTSLPVASMVFAARAAGISFSIASIAPQRMPMSRLPRSDWLGSSTSPPLMTRSNLSFGPIAALARRPDSVAAAAEPDSARKLRRDNADMLASPPEDYCCSNDDEANTAIAQAFPSEVEGTARTAGLHEGFALVSLHNSKGR